MSQALLQRGPDVTPPPSESKGNVALPAESIGNVVQIAWKPDPPLELQILQCRKTVSQTVRPFRFQLNLPICINFFIEFCISQKVRVHRCSKTWRWRIRGLP